jgi:hypothetical protein
VMKRSLIPQEFLASSFWVGGVKTGGDPSSGISSVGVLISAERHPACRQREARSGCRMERENLAGDAKGKGTSGSNREAESTDAPDRRLRPCGSALAINFRAVKVLKKLSFRSNFVLTVSALPRSRAAPARHKFTHPVPTGKTEKEGRGK